MGWDKRKVRLWLYFIKNKMQWILMLSCEKRNKNVRVCVSVNALSHVWLSATPWIIAHQAPLSMGFSRQYYWSRLLFLTPGDPHDPWIETASLASKEHEHRINTVTEYKLEDIIGDIWIHKVEWAFRIYKKSKSQIKPDFTYMMKRYCYHTREESSGTGIDCVLC